MANKSKDTTFTWNSEVIGHITSINGPNVSVDAIETTDLDDVAKTFIANIYDAGEVSLELEYDPADSDHDVLIDDMLAGTARTFIVTFSDSGNATFSASGFITSFSPTAAVNDRLGCAVTIKASGALTVAQ